MNKSFVDYIKFSIISKLFVEKIRCRHCGKLVRKDRILHHVYRECDYSMIECKCGKRVFNIFMKNHKYNCLYQ